ncbi:MAG: Gfo/Idh/MocA family oxidoreductase [Prosthecobacter sp.]|jgi:predicted dehydrogenase|uniref:Gfo/Idh/MocA family protein n=1 Tax=Prosthecobacter sp. TaxID=1965333 RepID=UPI0019F4C2AA|nr:Gfo/Idh/MocA family oxidoreductase [Prosthecobacter sp.]MBE2285105.1 Gfo/Idh/MocA family oxidoreductase [Prosthecobacter sp.]
MNTFPSLSRRSVLKSGLGGILAAGLAPQFIPARLLGADAPSKKITLGCIGVGKHGFGVNLQSFLQEDGCRVIAVCDAFKSRRANAVEAVNKKNGGTGCADIADFRELLARKDIDAAVISTPDHWHIPMATMAVEAGKHVFCEKPTLTIAEGRAFADLVARNKAVFATGLEDRSLIKYHKLCEVVRNGGIGKVRRIRITLPKKPVFPKEAAAPVPEDLNFNLWLGPAPQRDYFPSLTNDQVWRQMRDFSGGSLTDWGAHLIDSAQVAIGAENSSPVKVEGKGEIPPDSINTVPQTYQLTYTYGNGVVMEVSADKPAIRIEGSDGWVGVDGWDGVLKASDMEIFRRPIDPATNKLWPLPKREHPNFLEAIRNGKAPTYTAEALHRLSTTMHLGLIAMELGRPLRWDPKTESFDDEQANALRSRVSREDWRHD